MATETVLNASLGKRLASINESDSSKIYEVAYRKKWKELDEQFQQEERDEEERFTVKLQEYADDQRQAQRRWENRKTGLEASVKRSEELSEQLRREIDLLESRKRLLAPSSAQEKVEAVTSFLRLLQNAEREIARRPTGRECIACQSRIRDEVFLPCSHCSLCKECSERVTACPICRVTVTERVRIRWS